MKLKPYEVCQYAEYCPHNKDHTHSYSCKGADENRCNSFWCSLISSKGIFAKMEKKNLQNSLKKIKIGSKD